MLAQSFHKAQELKNPAPTAAISLKKPPEVVKEHREVRVYLTEFC